MVMGTVVQAPAVSPVAAVEDEQGRVYTAVWNTASNQFDALTYLTKLHGPDMAVANARGVVLGDFDGDGDSDLVAARAAGYCRVYPYLFRNGGSNVFVETDTPGLHGESVSWSMDLSEGDFDNDGFLDFLSGGDNGVVGVFLGDGTGRFRQRIMIGLESSSRGMDSADFDHDGNLDFVRATYSSGNLRYYRGNGDGTFAAPIQIADIGDDPYGVTAGDFDGDRHPDIMAISGGNGDAYFLKGLGNGTFSNPVYVASLDVNRHSAWDTFDFDGDGKLDVVGVDHDGRTARFFHGRGDGTFSNGVVIGTTVDNALAIAAPSLPSPMGTPKSAISPPGVTSAVGATVIFDGSSSADPGGSLVSNRWDFGDSSVTAWSNGAPVAVAHAFAAPGRYIARLRVRDNSGWQAVAAAHVVITAAAPQEIASTITIPESAAVFGRYPVTLAASNFVTAPVGSRRHWAPIVDVLDNFESGAATNWDFMLGSWSVSTNSAIAGSYSLRQDDSSLDRTYAVLSFPVEGDVVAECDAKFIGGSGQEMILLMANETPWSTGGEIIWRGRGLNDMLIGQYGADTLSRQLDYTPQLNVVYHLKALYRRGFVEGWVGTNYLGGARMFAGKTGRFGLATYRTQAVFDNFRVRAMDGQPREAPHPDLSENFDSGVSVNWLPTDGTWTVTTNPAISGWSYRQSDSSRDRATTRYAVVPTDDFVFETDLRYLGGYGQEAILYLWGERTDYRYEVLFRGRGINDLSVRRINTAENIIYQPALPFAPQTGVTYRIGVSRERGWLRFRINTNDLGRVYDPWVRVNAVGMGGYQSDLLYDNVSLRPQGSAANERYDVSRGTNLFALTTVTPWGGTSVSTVKVVAAVGSPPVANAGGPYAVDEFTGDAFDGGWKVAFKGTNSTDTDSGIAKYQWDFGVDTFDGATVDAGKWLYSAGTTQGGGILTSVDGYLYSREPVSRVEGQIAEARLQFSNNDGMQFGFKRDDDATEWQAWCYALHAHNTAMYAVFDGNHIDLGRSWTIGGWYDIRIELKAVSGARFYFKRAADTNWTLAYETDSGTATTFRRGLYSGAGTTVAMDSIREVAGGATPTWRFYTPRTSAVVLTVWDQALQSRCVTTTVARTFNAPPIANLGSNRVFYESNAIDCVWTIPFSATNSTDDHGIWTYEWDWDYDGTFTPSGDIGPNATHSWNTVGVWTAALRVTDHTRQTHVSTSKVTTVMGAPPVARCGGPYLFTEANAGSGAWNVQFTGTNSTDAESQIVQYVWDLGVDTFNTPATLREKWVHSGDAHITGGVLTFDWLSGSYDAGHYCFTHDSFTRVRSLRAETRLRFGVTDNEVVFGFKTDDESNTHWNQWTYGLHDHLGTLCYVENSDHVSLGIPIQNNVWYDWRIELKEGSGARYYYKRADQTDWILVRDSAYSSATTFRRGYHLYHGSFEADTYTEWADRKSVV
jgi:hypothetical protein